jgi:ABC-type branched-subunit amino acid transport system ATPase component
MESNKETYYSLFFGIQMSPQRRNIIQKLTVTQAVKMPLLALHATYLSTRSQGTVP